MTKKASEKTTEKKKTTSQSTAAKAPKAAKVKTEAAASGAAKRKVDAKAPTETKEVRVGRMAGKACKIKSCKQEYRAKGYCRMHYRKWRNGAFGRARYKTCGDVGCFKPQSLNRHGYCEEHFQNYYVKGMEVTRVPMAAAPAPKVEEKKAAG